METVVFALMMEAVRTSETLVNYTSLHGATTQKIAIFDVFLLQNIPGR
jgi:hypothetical protein